MIRVFTQEEDIQTFVASVLIGLMLVSSFYLWQGADAATQSPTLSVTVESTLSFTVSTDNFSNLTPGTPVHATSTLDVDTNNSTGWNVTLSGDNVTTSAQTMNDGGSNEITDLDPQWDTNGVATTSAANAVSISDGQDVLAFRVMTASGTQSFISDSWWGSDDTKFTNALWAGIASSTNVSKIGDSSVSSGGASALNTVQYYLDTAASQATGSYTGGLTYTATANP